MRRVPSVLLLAIVVASAAACSTSAPVSNATTGPTSTADTAAASPTDTGPIAASSTTPTDSPVPSVAPTPAPTDTPAPTPSPSPTPVPILACAAAHLQARVTLWSGAMGNQIADITLTNVSSTTCKLRGTPEVQLVDAIGVILLDSKTAGPAGLPHVSSGDPTFLLAHNVSVRTQVDTSDYCGAATPVAPTTVAFILPSGGGRLVVAAGPGGSTPPCNSAPGTPGSVAMNGWAK